MLAYGELEVGYSTLIFFLCDSLSDYGFSVNLWDGKTLSAFIKKQSGTVEHDVLKLADGYHGDGPDVGLAGAL